MEFPDKLYESMAEVLASCYRSIDWSKAGQRSAHDGQTIADATRDLLVGYTTNSKIRYHVEHLAEAGLIEVDRRIKGRVFVSLTKAGREALV